MKRVVMNFDDTPRWPRRVQGRLARLQEAQRECLVSLAGYHGTQSDDAEA